MWHFFKETQKKAWWKQYSLTNLPPWMIIFWSKGITNNILHKLVQIKPRDDALWFKWSANKKGDALFVQSKKKKENKSWNRSFEVKILWRAVNLVGFCDLRGEGVDSVTIGALRLAKHLQLQNSSSGSIHILITAISAWKWFHIWSKVSQFPIAHAGELRSIGS